MKSEMGWHGAYMVHEQMRAMAWGKLDVGEGHKAYAFRQADMWRRFGMEGVSIFNGSDKGLKQGVKGEPGVKIEGDDDAGLRDVDMDAGDIESEYDPEEPFE